MKVYETDKWAFIQASQYLDLAAKPPRTVRLGVIHDMEWKAGVNTAEDCANDFAHRTKDNPGSCHAAVDSNSVVQCVHDHDVAYAAPGCNNDGIQIELAGFARSTLKEWMTGDNFLTLMNGADVMAQYCLKYDIPPIHLSNTALASGAKGIIGHYQATEVYKKSDHMDPGPNFPWTLFIAAVAVFADIRR